MPRGLSCTSSTAQAGMRSIRRGTGGRYFFRSFTVDPLFDRTQPWDCLSSSGSKITSESGSTDVTDVQSNLDLFVSLLFRACICLFARVVNLPKLFRFMSAVYWLQKNAVHTLNTKPLEFPLNFIKLSGEKVSALKSVLIEYDADKPSIIKWPFRPDEVEGWPITSIRLVNSRVYMITRTYKWLWKLAVLVYKRVYEKMN